MRESYEEKKLLLYGKALEEAAELAVPQFASLLMRVKAGIEDCFCEIWGKQNQLFDESKTLKSENSALRGERD